MRNALGRPGFDRHLLGSGTAAASSSPPIPPRWAVLWLLSLLAALSHIFLDWTNNYGVRPFFPFNPRWYALDIAFILTRAWWSLPLPLLGLLLPAIFGLADREIGARKPLFRGRGWAIAAMVLVGIDLGVRAVEHHRALHLISNARFGDQSMLQLEPSLIPSIHFFWFAVVATTRLLPLTGSVNTLAETVDTSDQDDVIFKPPVTPAVEAAKRSWLGRVYLDRAGVPPGDRPRAQANLIAFHDRAPLPQDGSGGVPGTAIAVLLLARNGRASACTNQLWALRTRRRGHRRHGQ